MIVKSKNPEKYLIENHVEKKTNGFPEAAENIENFEFFYIFLKNEIFLFFTARRNVY